MSAVIAGVGPDAPTVTNDKGGKQSASPYRVDLLPPKALLAVAEVVAIGAKKYAKNNWKLISIDDHLSHAGQHLLAYLAGDESDDHMGHFACRALFALEMHREGHRPAADGTVMK